MTDTRLVLPYDVEGALVETIDAHHAEHLAKLERARGESPRTYETYNTVVRMSDAGALRLSGDTVPAVLLGVIGAPDFRKNEENGFDVTYQVGMQVTVMGQRRRDTLMRRDATAWTTVECLIQRLPRGGDNLVHSIRLTDYEPLAEADTQRVLGDARMVFEVVVRNAMMLVGVPADGRDWPASAGGAPAAPYDPLGPPPSAEQVTFDVDRLPLIE